MSHHIPCRSSTLTSLTYNDDEPITSALGLPPAQEFLEPPQEEDQHGLSYYLALARAAAERCMKKCSRRNESDEEPYEDEFDLIEEMALQLPEDRKSVEQSVHGRILGCGVSDDDDDLDGSSSVRIEEGAGSTGYRADNYAELVGILLVPPSLHQLCSKPQSHS